MSYYSNGTVTVVAGSALVSSEETVFMSMAQPGDLFTLRGTAGVIKTVISNTQLELTAPWAGTSSPTDGESGYAILHTSDAWHSTVMINENLLKLLQKVDALTGGSGGTPNPPPPGGGTGGTPLTYTTPAIVFQGDQEFEFIGRKPQQDYSYRLYSNGVERFEVRPGDKEASFDGNDPLDRVQMDGGGQNVSWFPRGWMPGGPTSGNLDYEVHTEFDWTPIQNVPAGSWWELFYEWHHHNPQFQATPHAPIAFGFNPPANGKQQLFLNFRNYPSIAAAQAAIESRTPPTLRQTLLIDTVQQGRTYKFREHVKFHATDGIYRLWLDGIPIVNYTGEMVGYINTPHFPQYGLYRETSPRIGISEFLFNPAKKFERVSPTHPISTAFFNASLASLTERERNSINNFVADLVAAGIPLDGASSGIWICCMSTLDPALRDLLHPARKATINGIVTHTPKQSMRGNGQTGSYVDTLSEMTAADATVFMIQGEVALVNGTPANNPVLGDTAYTTALGRFDGFFEARLANAGASFFGGNDGGDNGKGFMAGVRTSSTRVSVYHDVPYGTGTSLVGSGDLAQQAYPGAGNTLRMGQVANLASATPVQVFGKIASNLNSDQIHKLRIACQDLVTRQAAL